VLTAVADNVVAAAKANGLRLIVALTNNWSDYGGMDVYTKQLTGSANHDVFYTNSLTQTAYKNYAAAFVGRYKNEPTILAWELGAVLFLVLSEYMLMPRSERAPLRGQHRHNLGHVHRRDGDGVDQDYVRVHQVARQ
jgi:hypothetical protein